MTRSKEPDRFDGRVDDGKVHGGQAGRRAGGRSDKSEKWLVGQSGRTRQAATDKASAGQTDRSSWTKRRTNEHV